MTSGLERVSVNITVESISIQGLTEDQARRVVEEGLRKGVRKGVEEGFDELFEKQVRLLKRNNPRTE